MNPFTWLSNLSKTQVVLIGAFLVLSIGSIDYLTGPAITLSLFYLVPVLFVCSYTNVLGGVIFSAASALTSLIADLTWQGGHMFTPVPYWNAGIRFGVFLVLTYVFSLRQKTEEELAERIEELQQRNEIITDLSTMADLLQACSKKEEAFGIISRFGARLFPEWDAGVCVINSSRNAVEKAKQVQLSISALKAQHRGHLLGKITASFGISTFPVHGYDADLLVKCADAALYEAKNTGRDRIIVARYSLESGVLTKEGRADNS